MQLALGRFFLTLFLGLMIPAAVGLVVEGTPTKYRGCVQLIYVGSTFVIGELWAIFVSWIPLYLGYSSAWRYMFIFATLPVILSFFLNVCCLQESPRFLMIKDKFDEGYEVLSNIAEYNQNEEMMKYLE